MSYCMITFRSVTPAQRGEGLVKRAGMMCIFRRTPRWMEEQGCGYSLQIRRKDLQAVLELLRANRVAFQKVYTLPENGQPEELTDVVSG